MALGNKKSNEQTTNAKSEIPAFEEEGDTATAVQQEATSAEAPVSAEAKVAATTAIATAKGGSLANRDEIAAKAKAFQKELDEMRGANDFAYGNFRTFKAHNGEIMESGGEEETLGKWAKVRLIGWDNHFEVSPGEQGASTKDFVAYSKDGKIIDSVIGSELKKWVGGSVEEYLAHLRDEEDFGNAKKREFIDCACALLGTESGDGPVNSVVQITLATSSLSSFNKYQQDLKNNARCAMMGLPGFAIPEDPFTFFFVREQASKGTDKWTKLKIAASLPAKI